jgi:hypothetical protein
MDFFQRQAVTQNKHTTAPEESMQGHIQDQLRNESTIGQSDTSAGPLSSLSDVAAMDAKISRIDGEGLKREFVVDAEEDVECCLARSADRRWRTSINASVTTIICKFIWERSQ